MLDRVLAVLALAALGAFLFVLVSFVTRTDLIAVVAACFALAATDFYLTLRRKR